MAADGELILQGNVQGVFPASVFTIFALCSFIASCVFYAPIPKRRKALRLMRITRDMLLKVILRSFRAMYLSKPKDGRLSPMH